MPKTASEAIRSSPLSAAPAPEAPADLRGVQDFWRMARLSVGYLGIGFACAIELGQMSPILESLGSDPRLTGLIWCAGPFSGLVIQPLSGLLSDASQSVFGRRRPFMLLGMLAMALSLALMPHCTGLWMAALLLWGIEGGNNFNQGAYRPLVPDRIAPMQQTLVFSMMGFAMGLGFVLGFLTAFLWPNPSVLFELGAVALLLCMGVTILATPEYESATAQKSARRVSFWDQIRQVGKLPREGLKLCLVNSLTWFAINGLFFFFSLYVPHHVFGAASPGSAAYRHGVQWASLGYAVLNTTCFVFSAFISRLCARFSKKAVHTLGLLCMGGAFCAMPWIHDPGALLWAMALMGIGWGTVVSVPYAWFSQYLSAGKEGAMMGVFNMFVAGPGLFSSLVLGQIVLWMGNDVAAAMGVAGVSVLLSALLLQGVAERKPAAAE